MSVSSEQDVSRGQYQFRLGDELRGERATLGKSLLDVQRDLRIKAAYIDAIENADVSVFPNPSFVAGYVRSYARYLHLDPDEVYRRFCQESGFGGVHRYDPAGALPKPATTGLRTPGVPGRAAAARGGFDFPLAEPQRRGLPAIPVGAIGSLLVLVALIGGVGYGAWTVLQNIQRVQFAPVEEVPLALDEVAPLQAPETAQGPALPDFAAPVAATALVDLYRQQELEVPILVPRDGPIAALDPERVGLLGRSRPETAVVASLGTLRPGGGEDFIGPVAPVAASADLAADLAVDLVAAAEGGLPEPQVLADDGRPRVVVIAERPAWIRVYHRGGGIIFERILESGEVYEVPETDEVPMIWAGNSGSVYVRIGETLHGPIGRGTRATRDVPLDPEALVERFEVVADVPGIIADTIGSIGRPAEVLVQ